MPTSRPIVLNYVCNRILQLKPQSVLDVGVGFGKWGFLAREYTDVWHGNYFHWKTQIDGIEGFKQYIGLLQRLIYGEIFIGDALEVIDGLGQYDLIICADVLEHLEKEQGKQLLEKMCQHGKLSIVVLPIYPSNQGAVNGNEYERHRARWTFEELGQFGDVFQKDIMFILEMEGGK